MADLIKRETRESLLSQIEPELGGSGPWTRLDRAILVLTLLIVVMPVLLDLATGGLEVPFRYLAADSFYYSTVARNIALSGAVSFDGVHPTNGFHPLWQATLGLLYAACSLLPGGEVVYLTAVVVLCALLAAAAVWLLARAVVASGRRVPARFVLLPVGVYPLLLLPFWTYAIDVKKCVLWSQGPYPLFGTLWSYMNGMESGLVLLAFSAMAVAFAAKESAPVRSAVALGLLASALTLARLDHVFFSLVFLGYYAGSSVWLRTRSALIELGLFALGFGLPLGAYLVWSYGSTGLWLPVSGTAKTTFPQVTSTNLETLGVVIHHTFTGRLAVSRMFRVTQLLIPAAAALAVIAGAGIRFLWRPVRDEGKRLDNWTTFLLLTAGGVIALGGYNFLFVKTFNMGHWYVPVSVLFTSLVMLIPSRKGGALRKRWLQRASVYVFACMAVFFFLHRRPEYHRLYADCYFREGPAAREFYGDVSPRLLAHDDGIIAFATGFPCMSGTGLVLDKEAADAQRRGRLTELALARGFDRTSSLVYFLPQWAGKDGAHEIGYKGALASIERLTQGHRGHRRHQHQLEYISESGNLWIIRCVPRRE